MTDGGHCQHVQGVQEDWNPETITYDHQPNVSGVYQDYCRVLKKSVFVEGSSMSRALRASGIWATITAFS